MTLATDLLNPLESSELRKHKLKRLVQSPNSYFMDVKCPNCFNITTVFSHAQTVVVCGGCATTLCQPTGGKALLTDQMSEETKRSRMSPPSSTRQLPPQSSLPPPSASVPQQMTPPVPPLQYEEPEDAASPTRPVCFEVVKNGVILETTPLMSKSLWVVGRLPICDLSLEHQSISRYHAVIQSRQDGSLLLYDMDSSHGTSLNKTALPPRRHVRLTNGDMIRFGQSTRIYIVQGLEQQQQDYEDDAGKGVDHKNKMHLSVPVEEEHEVTWGFREDAVEPGSLLLSKLDDIQADPDAYYHRDPKKAFRTWCEANHHDSEFEVLEEKFGRSRGFVARITLSLDGGVEELECVGQGDRKKEAEARAALDACIKLDKLGILRSGGNSNALKKEKRRIKEMLKNMDDDSDSYYDRTDRRDKVPTSSTKSKTLAVKAETFESLSVKHIDIFKRISVLEVEIESAPKDLDVLLDLDDLDQYVKQLQRNVEKQKISNLKSSLTGLRQELQDVDRLLKIVRPDFDPSNLDTENKALSPPPPPPPAAVTAAPPSSSSSLSSFSLPSPLPILTITPTKRKLHEEEVKLPPPPSLEDKQPLAGKRKRVADVMTQQAAAEHLSVESEEMVDAVGRQQQQQDVRKLNSAYGY